MKTRRQWMYYILLNVVISASVVGVILFVYSRVYRQDCPASVSIATSSSTTPSPVPGRVDIVSVQGAGSPGNEVLVIKNNGSDPLVLTGWYLKDEANGIYLFPQLTLFPAGMVRIHSGEGTDTASDLYWGLSESVWSSGELAVLYDAQDVARALYRIP